MTTLTQDDKKRAVARKAIDFVPDNALIGVGNRVHRELLYRRTGAHQGAD